MTKLRDTVMIALGGNALSPKSEAGTIEQQFTYTKKTLKSLMHFVRKNYNICITHGNGPQVGAELDRNEIAADRVPPLPLGVLVANTQGAMGYMIQQSLQNALYYENSEREVVSFISQMKVDGKDPAIHKASKYIGKSYNKELAKRYMDKYQWYMKEQEPDVWRRVVPSPSPLYIFNGNSIKHLVDYGTIVIAGGGGGIPAYNVDNGSLEGLDGVIDKDMTAALLGRIIKAQKLFIITDVDNIYLNFKTNSQEIISDASASDIESWLKDGHFWRGSMEPKIQAALYFLKYHGKEVIITSIDNIEQAIQKQAGTRILKS
jgi:carbamate kinase